MERVEKYGREIGRAEKLGSDLEAGQLVRGQDKQSNRGATNSR